MNDSEFLRRLANCSLPVEAFNHRGHLRAAYLVLGEAESFGAALERMRGLITAYAESLGKAGLYHETITVAFMALVNARRHEADSAATWEGFAAANPDLFDIKILERHYDTAVLQSDLARRVFLLPG